MTQPNHTSYHWLCHGDEAFPAMLHAIGQAARSVHLETYHFEECPLGESFLQALIQARQRQVEVQVVIDFLGSKTLRSGFWDPLIRAGGRFRWFNPWNPLTLGIRNHRKILVCDRQTAFVGGFNIAPSYVGDGVTQGWRDLGLQINGPLADILADCVEYSFERADFKHNPLHRLRRSFSNLKRSDENWTLLLGGPGRGRKYIKRDIARGIRLGRSVKIISAYFLPTWSIRRELLRKPRHGGDVQLILPEKTDIALTKMATRCLYGRFLRAGVRIHEYRPQILHAKLIIIDDDVYVGSCNLDRRSLNINYEILIKITDATLAREARTLFARDLQHCRPIHRSAWKKARPFWQRWFGRMAYFLLARLDPYLSQLASREVP